MCTLYLGDNETHWALIYPLVLVHMERLDLMTEHVKWLSFDQQRNVLCLPLRFCAAETWVLFPSSAREGTTRHGLTPGKVVGEILSAQAALQRDLQ